MRFLEVRRHCFTKKEGEGRGRGSHLSPAGVRQARRIGGEIGPFRRVLVSDIPRTMETALAMGFAVDDVWPILGQIPLPVWEEIGHQERWAWENPFATFAEFLRRGGPTADLGQAQKEAWTAALESVSPGEGVLVVTHGRVLEAGLVCCFPNEDFAPWGHPFHHGEGIRIEHDAGRFRSVTLRRETRPV